MPRMKSFFRVTAPVLAAGRTRLRLRRQRRLQGQIVRDEKRFKIGATGTPELHLTTFDGAIEIQAWDKPDVAIDVEKRGRDQGSRRRAGDQDHAGRQPDRARGEAAAHRVASAASASISRRAPSLIVSVPRDVNIVARERRRVDHDRTCERPARAANRRRQHPRLGRRRRADPRHRRRLGDGRRRTRTARRRYGRRRRERHRPADERQAAHRRRLDRLSRRAGQRDGGQLGHHDRRRQRDALPAERLRRRARRPHRRRLHPQRPRRGGRGPKPRQRRKPPHAARPARRRRQDRFASAPATATIRLQAAPEPRLHSHRAVDSRSSSDPSIPASLERVPPLPALAAAAAVQPADRLHARERQLERHAERASQADHVGLVHVAQTAPRSRWRSPGRATARRAIVAKNSGVASGNGLPASGPM